MFSGALQDVVIQGWRPIRPLGHDEADPSNWTTQLSPEPTMFTLWQNTLAYPPPNTDGTHFKIFPPLMEDPFRTNRPNTLQSLNQVGHFNPPTHNSPTTPFHMIIHFSSSSRFYSSLPQDSKQISPTNGTSQPYFATGGVGDSFTGNKRHDSPLQRSHSLSTYNLCLFH